MSWVVFNNIGIYIFGNDVILIRKEMISEKSMFFVFKIYNGFIKG